MFTVRCESYASDGSVVHAFNRIWLSREEVIRLVDQILNPAVVVPGQNWDRVIVTGT